MASFSWSDSLHAAVGPCLACFKVQHDNDDEEHGPHFIPRARPDELEGLLADTDDADTLSLHSSFGDREGRRWRRHRSSSHKGIKLFGFYLFGRPPIHLPDDEEAEHGQSGSRDGGRDRARTISASTLDSDASPLDPSTIDELTAARVAEQVAQHRGAERLAKKERRRQRRERKEAQRAALSLALSATDGQEFEGFQGSGATAVPPRSLGSDTHSSSATEEFGPYQDAHLEVDGADFGAEQYARRTSSAGTGSDRSRTSTSVSSPDPSRHSYNHHYLSQQGQQSQRPQHKKQHSSGRRHSLSTSRSSTSQSGSVPSPTSHQTSFPAIAEHDIAGDSETHLQRSATLLGPHDVDIVSSKTTMGFPSTGLPGAPTRKNSEAGVFLARRGEE